MGAWLGNSAWLERYLGPKSGKIGESGVAEHEMRGREFLLEVCIYTLASSSFACLGKAGKSCTSFSMTETARL